MEKTTKNNNKITKIFTKIRMEMKNIQIKTASKSS